MAKQPFDLPLVLDRVEETIRPMPKAVLFALFDEGHTTTFEQAVACLISARTREETTIEVARRLFAVARTPEAIAALSVAEIDALIDPATFHEPKAAQIRAIANRAIDEYTGDLPCDAEVLRSLPGIGPKCTALILGISCGVAAIGVDIHVHRVTNRWGIVRANTPEQTAVALETVLPVEDWVRINRLLVPFGKYLCTGTLPRCSACPVVEFCRQVGVDGHR